MVLMTTSEITCSVASIGASPCKTSVKTDLEMVPLPYFYYGINS